MRPPALALSAMLLPALCATVASGQVSTALADSGGYLVQVDAQHPAASDRNPGTAAHPLKTIAQGARLALAANARGAPVTVQIHPGIYREAVVLPKGGTSAAITFQATEAGKAVLSGADLWTGWRRQGATAVFAHEWPFRWGLAPMPRHWPSVQEIVRRREMVVVGGRLLRQVLTQTSLEEGTFYIDEAGRTVYLWAPGTIDPDGAAVEVAVRPTLFAASGRANLTLSGLVFEHAATPLDGNAVAADHMTNFHIHDATFRRNNWGGLGIYDSTQVAVLRSTATHNGARGMEASKIKSLVYSGNETSHNNWRGAWGGFYDWAMGGLKLLRVHGGTITDHRAISNLAHGLWLDTDNQDITITGGFWCDNVLNGGFVEASQGPITIVRATACVNGKRGLFATESSNLTVRDSALYGNERVQFEVGGEPDRQVTNWETGTALAVRAENLTLCGNAIVSKSGGQDVLAVPRWSFLLTSLRSRRNTWWNPQNPASFRLERSTRLDLAGWRRASGQDGDSTYADPRFADPVQWDFRPVAGSGWSRC